MRFKQADILGGLEKSFIARMMEVGVKSTYEPATVLFSRGDPANRFFIMVKGRVRLSMGDNRNSIYMVNHGGEAFGWSSLVGNRTYTASAECISPSTLIAFDRDQMEKLMAGDPDNAVLFFKNLALTLGNRLMVMNSQLADNLSSDANISYGTGQVQEAVETA
jgi:CRP-like cAMP-binding protein